MDNNMGNIMVATKIWLNPHNTAPLLGPDNVIELRLCFWDRSKRFLDVTPVHSMNWKNLERLHIIWPCKYIYYHYYYYIPYFCKQYSFFKILMATIRIGWISVFEVSKLKQLFKDSPIHQIYKK